MDDGIGYAEITMDVSELMGYKTIETFFNLTYLYKQIVTIALYFYT